MRWFIASANWIVLVGFQASLIGVTNPHNTMIPLLSGSLTGIFGGIVGLFIIEKDIYA